MYRGGGANGGFSKTRCTHSQTNVHTNVNTCSHRQRVGRETQATSIYGAGPVSVIERPYSAVPPISLDLPAAHTLDDRASNYFY
ncbi:hypothetical protein ANCDUO_20129 [Ancylostoma duodenale]|uniref:Uncharacterized protein n=1 Tax=Ancylostoma duodenale TaxID=51022 RepID=A0A0C2FMH6_9BILA|nr:hypothetical protein ANCDUO_20129 [Ancylostoma duodenale]